MLLEKTLEKIERSDANAMKLAKERQVQLTKPAGSLGVLEDLSIQIAGITANPRPKIGEKVIFVMAGDHGIAKKGVSAFPQEVTPGMVHNFLSGGAAVNVLASFANSRIVVTDCGILAPIERSGLKVKRIGSGTKDISVGAAMTREEAIKAIEAGIEAFEEEWAKKPFSIAATGDMGIGNTTPSSCIVAAITKIKVEDAVGRGTGINDAALQNKIALIKQALEVNKPECTDGLDVLAKVGGFEIGAIAGTILAAASHKIPVVVDGFISTAGALIAALISPESVDAMISAHKSVEKGHIAALEFLGKKPILDLGFRLGEGTGAAIGMTICDAACRVLDEMATFAEAGVAGAE